MERVAYKLLNPQQAHTLLTNTVWPAMQITTSKSYCKNNINKNMRNKQTDITGKTFGRLTALRFDKYEKEKTYWIFKCACGTEKSQPVSRVKSGVTNSCGCLRLEMLKKATIKHGMTRSNIGKKSKVYQAWQNMILRCEYNKSKHFHRYGGRGIKVCLRWRSSFNAFFEDMGEPPDGFSLDRINNDGDYEPANCRWASQKMQVSNRSVCNFVEINGERLLLLTYCENIGVSHNMVRKRLKRGWELDKALSVPPKR